MTAPLEHMLRNAVAHGLEAPAERKKHKKSEEGSIRIAVRREGSEVVLEVSDDGAGLNRGAIRKRAEERGLIRSDAVLADADLDALIMEPGFTTISRLPTTWSTQTAARRSPERISSSGICRWPSALAVPWPTSAPRSWTA